MEKQQYIRNVLTITKNEMELPNTAPYTCSIVRVEINRCFNHPKIILVRYLPDGRSESKLLNGGSFSIARKTTWVEHNRGFAIITPDCLYKILVEGFKKGDEVKIFLQAIKMPDIQGL